MSRRGAGVIFIAVAAFLLGTKYVCAAIFGSSTTSWTAEFFNFMLSYIGTRLNTFSLIAFIVGITYLIWAEIEDWTKRQARGNDKPPSSH